MEKNRAETAVVEDPGRLSFLRKLNLPDNPPMDEYDRLMKLTADLLDAPVVQFGLVEEDHTYYLSNFGVDVEGHEGIGPLVRDALENHDDVTLVEEARTDDRIPGSEINLEGKAFRATAVCAVVVDGWPVGVLVVRDVNPRRFSDQEKEHLKLIARQVGDLIQRTHKLNPTNEEGFSDERLEAILDSAGELITVIDDDGVVKLMNSAGQDLLGYDRESLVGESLFDLLHPEDRKQFEEAFDRVTSNPDSVIERGDFRALDADGCTVSLAISCTGQYESAFDGFVVTARDISKQSTIQQDYKTIRQRFDYLVNHTGEIFWIHDARNEEILFLNSRVEDIWGQPPEAFYDNPDLWFDAIYESDRDAVRDAFRPGNEEIDVEYRIKRPDGEIRWIHDRGFPVRNDSGEVIRFVGSARDITDRKHIEMDLKETLKELKETRYSRDHLHEIVDTVPAGLFILNRLGQITLLNDSILEMLGYEETDLRGKRVSALLEGDLMEHEFQRITESEPVINIEKTFMTQSDEKIPVLFSARGLFDESGELNEIVCVGLDISQRKQAQEALRESERRFRQMAENIEEVIFMYKSNWSEMLYVNSRYEEIWGQSLDKLEEDPTDFMRGIHPDDRPMVEEALERMAAGESLTLEYRVNESDDYSRYVQSDGIPIKDDDGTVTRIVGTVREITELKRTQTELEETIDERNSLLKEVHHRVKNNLQVINSIMSLHEYTNQGSTEDFIAECQNRIRSIASIHERLYQSDNLAELSFAAYVRDLVGELIKLNAIPEKNIDLTVDVDPHFKLSLRYAVPCGLIVHELVSNACQHAFAPDRENKLIVSCQRKEDTLVLSVKDNGPGFPDDFRLEDVDTVGFEILKALGTYELEGDLRIQSNGMNSVKLTLPVSNVLETN
ncbi:MAG: PAS domain S-box protein [bacterium]